MEMSDRDKDFFETHWHQWVKRNPPPYGWLEKWTLREWAEFEMPCIGFLGRAFYWFSMQLNN
jgi:hypothetical protein